MIISAAVKGMINGRAALIPVHRHCDFFDIMKQLGCEYDKNSLEQGFIDYSPGKKECFVNRVEAMKIAKACNQLLHPEEKEQESILYSEDIY